MSDLPDFLSDEPSSTPEPEANPEPAPEPETQEPAQGQPEAPARGPDGKFAPKPTDAPQEPLAATPEAPQGHAVPLATFLELRDRATAAEKKAQDLEQWRQQQEAARNRQPAPEAPDPAEDPHGWAEHQRSVMGHMMFVQARDMSRRFAEIQHGKETVDQAWEWGVQRCDDDPHFNAKVLQSPDPAGFVLSEYRNQQLLTSASEMTPEDIAAFQAWKAAQAQPTPQPAAPAASAKPVPPRPSLASGPSAGATANVSPQSGSEMFAEMFGSKG